MPFTKSDEHVLNLKMYRYLAPVIRKIAKQLNLFPFLSRGSIETLNLHFEDKADAKAFRSALVKTSVFVGEWLPRDSGGKVIYALLGSHPYYAGFMTPVNHKHDWEEDEITIDATGLTPSASRIPTKSSSVRDWDDKREGLTPPADCS